MRDLDSELYSLGLSAGEYIKYDGSNFVGDTPSSSNIGNSDLTISSAGIRKLTLGGALATDGFVTRNSADTFNTFETLGDGQFAVRQDAGANYIQYNSSQKLVHSATGGRLEQTSGLYPHTLATGGALANGTRTTANAFTVWQNGNFVFGNNSGIQTGNGKYAILVESGTAPTSNVTNHAYFYVSDIVAGNACPHFRTENGSIVKLFQGAALTAADTDLTVSAPVTADYVMNATSGGWGCSSQDEFNTMTTVIRNLQDRVNELEDRLQAHGLIA